MGDRRARRESGSALLVTVMLLLMLGLVGLAALNTTTRDRQVAGFQNRKRIALYAAEAGVAEALETLTTGSTPAVSTTTLGDATLFPHGQPSYQPDPTAAQPIEDLGDAPFPGMSLNLGQGGLPTYQLNYWRVRVQGNAPGGSVARLEAVSGALRAN
jgi:Tfp pilus assembly protein PilX